jgi:hypothetical protein
LRLFYRYRPARPLVLGGFQVRSDEPHIHAAGGRGFLAVLSLRYSAPPPVPRRAVDPHLCRVDLLTRRHTVQSRGWMTGGRRPAHRSDGRRGAASRDHVGTGAVNAAGCTTPDCRSRAGCVHRAAPCPFAHQFARDAPLPLGGRPDARQNAGYETTLQALAELAVSPRVLLRGGRPGGRGGVWRLGLAHVEGIARFLAQAVVAVLHVVLAPVGGKISRHSLSRSPAQAGFALGRASLHYVHTAARSGGRPLNLSPEAGHGREEPCLRQLRQRRRIWQILNRIADALPPVAGCRASACGWRT